MRPLTLPLLLAVASLPGCVGNIRDTTTVRSAHEILLISTAAQRALRLTEHDTKTRFVIPCLRQPGSAIR